MTVDGLTSSLALESAIHDRTYSPSTGNDAIGPEEARQRALVFKALAAPKRLQLLSIVKANGETYVCDLPGPLKLSKPTVSEHLRVLVEAGLLRRERHGVWVCVSLLPGALEAVARFLGEL